MGNINERIRKLRRVLDLTQTEFGEKIGIKQNSVTLIETGSRNISDYRIGVICREFNVNETWLRTGEGEMFIEMTRDEEIAAFFEQIQMGGEDGGAAFKRRFVALLSHLDDSAWEALADFAVKLVEEQERGKSGCGGADATADSMKK